MSLCLIIIRDSFCLEVLAPGVAFGGVLSGVLDVSVGSVEEPGPKKQELCALTRKLRYHMRFGVSNSLQLPGPSSRAQWLVF